MPMTDVNTIHRCLGVYFGWQRKPCAHYSNASDAGFSAEAAARASAPSLPVGHQLRAVTRRAQLFVPSKRAMGTIDSTTMPMIQPY